MLVYAQDGGGVVTISPPLRVMKMDHMIAVVRSCRSVERDPTDLFPVMERPPFK
jgi:hypothetical protein